VCALCLRVALRVLRLGVRVVVGVFGGVFVCV
jgi:hypothetical protein